MDFFRLYSFKKFYSQKRVYKDFFNQNRQNHNRRQNSTIKPDNLLGTGVEDAVFAQFDATFIHPKSRFNLLFIYLKTMLIFGIILAGVSGFYNRQIISTALCGRSFRGF